MMEIVHGGWLKKSPPEKRIWRAKWRRRWFVLRQSGQIPGQYVLEYFTDQSCRKLKGHIDLDQCEQVDAGVPLDAAGHKCNGAHVFDIRTPKRIYYLVADTEADMNKWVDCICAVCGLKMHLEEEYDVQLPDATVTVASEPSPTLSNSYDDQSAREETRSLMSLSTYGGGAASGPYIPISECHSGTNGFLLNSAHSMPRDEADEEMLPSHVPPPPPKHTLGGVGEPRKKMDSGEFYDYPRDIHPRDLDDGRLSPEVGNDDSVFRAPLGGGSIRRSPRVSTDGDEESCQQQQRPPPSLTAGSTNAGPPPPPPKVNWETYPRNESDAIYENRRTSSGCTDDTYDHPHVSYVGRTAAGAAAADLSDDGRLQARLSFTDSGVEVQRSSSSSPQDSIGSGRQDSTSSSCVSLPATGGGGGSKSLVCQKPPPRPPKPKPQHLVESLQQQQHGEMKKNNYDNIEDCEAMLYDVPPSAQGVFLSKNLPANAFAYLRDDSPLDHIPAVPPPCKGSSSMAASSMDEMYDFPRPLHNDQLGATPPAPSGDATWRRRHAYTNAPPTTLLPRGGEPNGAVAAADATLSDCVANDDDEYLSMDANKRRHSSEVYTDMSGDARSPGSVYCNVLSPLHKYDNVFVLETPPAVDRKLKPNKRLEVAGNGAVAAAASQVHSSASPAPVPTPTSPVWANDLNSTTPVVTYTRPGVNNPPAVNRTLKPRRMAEAGTSTNHPVTATLAPPHVGFAHQTNKKRSFRKPKEIPSPNVAAAHRRLVSCGGGGTPTTTLNNGLAMTSRPPKSDRSSSDDDQSSCCSSRRNSSNDDHATLKPSQHVKSPSPSQFGFGHRHEPEIQYLDLDLESDVGMAAAQSPKSPGRFTTNTVYKTVDFVKTKAFNEMRQNVEETYRKSQ